MGGTIGTIRELNHASKLIIRLINKHASSLNKIPTAAKYSRYIKPFKILIG